MLLKVYSVLIQDVFGIGSWLVQGFFTVGLGRDYFGWFRVYVGRVSAFFKVG